MAIPHGGPESRESANPGCRATPTLNTNEPDTGWKSSLVVALHRTRYWSSGSIGSSTRTSIAIAAFGSATLRAAPRRIVPPEPRERRTALARTSTGSSKRRTIASGAAATIAPSAGELEISDACAWTSAAPAPSHTHAIRLASVTRTVQARLRGKTPSLTPVRLPTKEHRTYGRARDLEGG